MIFKVGDIVTFINDAMNGVVMSVSGKKIIVDTDDGFEMICTEDELMKRGGSIDNEMASFIDKKTLNRVISENSMNNKSSSQKKLSRKDNYFVEVDLHIERILKRYKHLSSGDILDFQLERAKFKLEECIKTNKSGLVFIHGYGDGVLKMELNSLFERYNLQYHDADYAKYGMGATEVVLNL